MTQSENNDRLCGWLKLPKSNLVLGYICLASVVLQWVTSGFVVQYVFNDLMYKNTVTQTVYTVSFYSVLLIPHFWRAWKSRGNPERNEAALAPLEFVKQNKVKVSVLGCLWLGGQVVYVMSLMHTSMGTNTAVSSSSSAFSFIFSILILGYAFRWVSGLGVLVTSAGVVLTALFRAETPVNGGSTSTPETVEGIVMAVCAAACFGLFSVLFKKWIVDDKFGGVVFGSFGVIAFVVGVPLVIISHYAGIQSFELPDWKIWLIVTADATMSCFVNNVCLSRAFIYLTPVIVLVGLTMTTPLSIFADTVIFSNHSYSTLNVVGITLITVAVLVVGYDQALFEKSLEQRKESETKPEDEVSDIPEALSNSV